MNIHRASRTRMSLGGVGAAVLAVVAVWTFARHGPSARADEPAPVDRLERAGRPPLKGRLRLVPGTGFRFEREGSAARVEPGDVIGFDANAPSSTSIPPLFQVQIGETGRISGMLAQITRTGVQIGVPWRSTPILIQRPGVQAVVQRFGESRILADSFESLDGSKWNVEGKPGIAAEAGPAPGGRALTMPPGGTSIERRFDEPPSAGRVDLTLHDDGKIHPEQTWALVLTFRGPTGPADVRVVLGWAEESMAVESPAGPTLAVQRLSRSVGWQRLSVRFDADRTEIAVDGKELAHGKGPPGPLEAIRLATSGPESDDPGPWGLVGEVQVARFVQPPSSLEIDPSQDEARLVVGDQLFGTVVQGNGDRIEVTVDGRPVAVDWSDLAGVHLRRAPAESAAVQGTLARVEWRTSAGGPAEEGDFAEGAVTALTDAALTLATPFAGTLQIPRDRLSRLMLLPAGWRRVIDPSAHHLGNDISATPPLLDPPHPEGGVLERSFTLPDGLGGARFLVLDVVQVVGETPGLPFSEFIRRGELKTFVEINGSRFDYLNKYVRSTNETPERIRIPIAADLLRPGENQLRIVQTGIANNATWYDDLGIVCIAVEVEAPTAAAPSP